jgi:peptidoglycan/LPS O-acetylase OafA/YrhL
MPLILTPIFNYFHIPYQVPGLLNFVLSSLLTVGIASLSWNYIEASINNLKNHFQNRPKPATTSLVITPELLENEAN